VPNPSREFSAQRDPLVFPAKGRDPSLPWAPAFAGVVGFLMSRFVPRRLMKSADSLYVGYQFDNNIILRYNSGYADLITHNARTISGGSTDHKNTVFVAVLSLAEPAPSQDFRQNPTSSADNFLQKQQKQRGVPCFFAAETCCEYHLEALARCIAPRQASAHPVPPLMWCEAGRPDAEPATGTKRSAT
jgi:hypothetical protein